MKTTANNTIPFKQREEEKKISKYYKIASKTLSKPTSKVIPYPKYRRKKKNGAKFINHNKPLLIVILLAFSLSLISFINKDVKLNSNSKSMSSTSVDSRRGLTTTQFKDTSKIISLEVQKVLNLNSNTKIDTKTMHKNGSSIYAQGIVDMPHKGNVYFDVIVKNNKASSLVINGIEYIKK